MIDVIVSSCARPEILSGAMNSFFERVKTSHEIRVVIIEDLVNNDDRQKKGRDWIEGNADMFDEVVYLEKKAGFERCYQEVVVRAESDVFFRMEDDVIFVRDIEIDPIIEVMKDNENIAQTILWRDTHRFVSPKKKEIAGVRVTANDFFSISVGIHSTHAARAIVKACHGAELHETSVLTPVAMKLGFEMLVSGWEGFQYEHIGEHQGYVKGSWK